MSCLISVDAISDAEFLDVLLLVEFESSCVCAVADLHADKVCWIAVVSDLELLGDVCAEVIDEFRCSCSDTVIDPFENASLNVVIVE